MMAIKGLIIRTKDISDASSLMSSTLTKRTGEAGGGYTKLRAYTFMQPHDQL